MSFALMCLHLSALQSVLDMQFIQRIFAKILKLWILFVIDFSFKKIKQIMRFCIYNVDSTSIYDITTRKRFVMHIFALNMNHLLTN